MVKFGGRLLTDTFSQKVKLPRVVCVEDLGLEVFRFLTFFKVLFSVERAGLDEGKTSLVGGGE